MINDSFEDFIQFGQILGKIFLNMQFDCLEAQKNWLKVADSKKNMQDFKDKIQEKRFEIVY